MVKARTCTSVYGEGSYMHTCLGLRLVHAHLSMVKARTCTSVYGEGSYMHIFNYQRETKNIHSIANILLWSIRIIHKKFKQLIAFSSLPILLKTIIPLPPKIHEDIETFFQTILCLLSLCGAVDKGK